MTLGSAAKSSKEPVRAVGVTLRLTPRGRLVLDSAEDGAELDPARAAALERAFARGPGHGLLWLGAAEVGRLLPPALGYFRDLGSRFVTALCARPDGEGRPAPPAPPDDAELERLAAALPPMPGAEYLTPAVLRELWEELGRSFSAALAESGEPLQGFLASLNPAWHLVGRVCFNLAENRRDEEAPFAFLATYATRLSAHGKAQHAPLGQALREYAGEAQKDRLLSLLLPVQRATQRCGWLRELVDAGEIFHPLRWTAPEAARLLGDAPALEQAGVVVRLPASWRAGRPPRPRVTGTLGAKVPSGIGADALLDFRVAVTLDGSPLTPAELEALLAASSGLALLRGQWVEVDQARLARTLARLREAERLAAEGGLPFAEAMRLLAGADLAAKEGDRPDRDWSGIAPGPWLAETLAALRSPERIARLVPPGELRAELRPYQEVGVRWLQLLCSLGLGACLADDMGLGKTIQLIALLLARRGGGRRPPSLLVAPASLLGNWSAEIERFAPSLRSLVAHPSAMAPDELKALGPEALGGVELVVTTYGSLSRLPWIEASGWDLVVLDEAQAVKNPGAKQTRAVKRLRARARIALTGTPIENRLSDLWSIFDFLNPGLLGSAKEFSGYAKRLETAAGGGYGPLRDLVRPYVLRRLKTDPRVISDLPEKTELRAFCSLTKRQAALYQEAVDELREALGELDGMKRRGVVLAFLMRFKQICNHPSQWLGDGAWDEEGSGKWARLREIAEVIAARGEKVLVFTQFREVTGPLASFLGGLFGRPGLVLHGEIPVGRRRELVRRFQEDEAVPFFVLSLKAGGAGLNLTAASHVVHFDRWWNPAVEEQATDRAFRIGQKKNVLVHKLVCRGTVEEKIDLLIESKRQLSRDLLEGGAELNLTELGDAALLDLVRLDLAAAMKE